MTTALALSSTATALRAPEPVLLTLDALQPAAVAERLLAAAYSDCHEHHLVPGCPPERNLAFCAPVTVSVAEARKLLRRYLPGGYNAFEPRLLRFLPRTCRVRLAREGSVCLYVETTAPLDEERVRQDLRCDECDLYQVFRGVHTYRLFWD